MANGVQELEGEFDVVKSGKLSALQLEAIAYACQAHETRLPDGSRAGFFIGDGAGVSCSLYMTLHRCCTCNRHLVVSVRRQLCISTLETIRTRPLVCRGLWGG